MNPLKHAEPEYESVIAERKGVDLFDFLLVLSEARRTIAICMLVFVVLGVAISLMIKPRFSATSLIMPPQQGQSLATMMGQLNALASLTGGGGGGGLGSSPLKTPVDMYVGMLESRTIADRLISRFHLQDLYKTRSMEDTRAVLKSNTRFLAGKDGLIHIIVDDHDPNRSSEMANAYVDELYAMNSHLATTEAAQRRVFFDQELGEEKGALAIAENELKQTAEKTGVIQIGGQAEAIIRSLAVLRAEIASREVQINSMRLFATDQNPVAVRAEEEISSLRNQLARLEKDPRNPELASTFGIPAGRVPTVALEYARKLREVKYHETLFELLAKQYEAARIDEAKAAPIIQVVDRAVPPDRKSGPHRAWIVLGCGFIGFCIGYLSAAIIRAFRRAAEVPEYAIKIARLRSGFQFGR
ncbi:MAG TPA: Wzz/FepE/Etk N-terminal domain-containing protein [Candidatus Sulfotelmatobacter sp.]|jgi:tyrosine-protein kinase Etk/Wzc